MANGATVGAGLSGLAQGFTTGFQLGGQAVARRDANRLSQQREKRYTQEFNARMKQMTQEMKFRKERMVLERDKLDDDMKRGRTTSKIAEGNLKLLNRRIDQSDRIEAASRFTNAYGLASTGDTEKALLYLNKDEQDNPYTDIQVDPKGGVVLKRQDGSATQRSMMQIALGSAAMRSDPRFLDFVTKGATAAAKTKDAKEKALRDRLDDVTSDLIRAQTSERGIDPVLIADMQAQREILIDALPENKQKETIKKEIFLDDYIRTYADATRRQIFGAKGERALKRITPSEKQVLDEIWRDMGRKVDEAPHNQPKNKRESAIKGLQTPTSSTPNAAAGLNTAPAGLGLTRQPANRGSTDPLGLF